MTDIQVGNPDTKDPQIRSERGLCADCPYYSDCLFHMPRYGGFRGQGPRYVRYRLITDATEKSNAKEDFIACDNFVGGGLQDRMLTGQELRARGQKGELISILTDNSNTVTQGMEMGFNNRNQIVNPQPNLVADLKAAGYDVNQDDKAPAARWEPVTFKRTVPPYKKPQTGASNYSQEIAAKQALEQQAEEDAEAEIWTRRQRQTDDEPKRVKRKSLLDEAREDMA